MAGLACLAAEGGAPAQGDGEGGGRTQSAAGHPATPRTPPSQKTTTTIQYTLRAGCRCAMAIISSTSIGMCSREHGMGAPQHGLDGGGAGGSGGFAAALLLATTHPPAKPPRACCLPGALGSLDQGAQVKPLTHLTVWDAETRSLRGVQGRRWLRALPVWGLHGLDPSGEKAQHGHYRHKCAAAAAAAPSGCRWQAPPGAILLLPGWLPRACPVGCCRLHYCGVAGRLLLLQLLLAPHGLPCWVVNVGSSAAGAACHGPPRLGWASIPANCLPKYDARLRRSCWPFPALPCSCWPNLSPKPQLSLPCRAAGFKGTPPG